MSNTTDLQSQVKRFKEKARQAEETVKGLQNVLTYTEGRLATLQTKAQDLFQKMQQAQTIATAMAGAAGPDGVTLPPELLRSIEDSVLVGIDIEEQEDDSIVIRPTYAAADEAEEGREDG